MQPLSLCLTNYNRYELTVEAIASVVDDMRISEIVILDDHSTDGSYEKLNHHFMKFDHIHVLQQIKNVGMGKNKFDAIRYATNEWVIIFDSDNVIMSDYLDALEQPLDTLYHNENLIFCPEFAKPGFDYRKFAGKLITSQNAKNVVLDPMGNCMMNTCNYVVNRMFYRMTYLENKEAGCADTIWYNLTHLKAGGMFYVVPGMQYYHRQHEGSGFLQSLDYSMRMSEKFRQEIINL